MNGREGKELTEYHSSFVLTTRIPARRSLCPPKYLVPIQPNSFMYHSIIREGTLTTVHNNIRSPFKRVLQRWWPKRRIHNQLSSHSMDFISIMFYISRFAYRIQRRLEPTNGPLGELIVDPADWERSGTTGTLVYGKGGVHTLVTICYSDGGGLEVG